MPDHVDQTEHCRNSLRDYRSQSRSAHTHAKDQDRKKVETDVHEGGQEQEVDRCLAVSQTSDDARQHIIEVCDRDSKEDHKNVIIGALDNVLRRVHPLQNVHAEQSDDRRHDHRKHR